MKKFLFVIAVMLSSVLMASSGEAQKTDDSENNVTASFYPIYILAENVIGDTEGINLQNMAQPQTGCLHDYQLSTGDMKKLDTTDIFLINGGGMESFLDNALELFPQLNIVDTSRGTVSLENDGHDHEEEGEDEHSHNHEENSHFWILPQNAAVQAENICEALSEVCPDKADEFRENTDSFIESLNDIETFDGNGMKVCIFNEAFAYLHLSYGLDVRLCVEMDENQTPSAKEMAEIITAVKEENISLLIAADDASKAIADTVARETDAKVVVLDPVLTGDFSPKSYERP